DLRWIGLGWVPFREIGLRWIGPRFVILGRVVLRRTLVLLRRRLGSFRLWSLLLLRGDRERFRALIAGDNAEEEADQQEPGADGPPDQLPGLREPLGTVAVVIIRVHLAVHSGVERHRSSPVCWTQQAGFEFRGHLVEACSVPPGGQPASM